MRPQGNGLVEIAGTKTIERGWFCMRLVEFINEEAEMGTQEYGEIWNKRFAQGKAGQCAYRDKCPIYAKTPKRPKQLKIEF